MTMNGEKGSVFVAYTGRMQIRYSSTVCVGRAYGQVSVTFCFTNETQKHVFNLKFIGTRPGWASVDKKTELIMFIGHPKAIILRGTPSRRRYLPRASM